jgi:hypothetical protein
MSALFGESTEISNAAEFYWVLLGVAGGNLFSPEFAIAPKNLTFYGA